MNSHQIINANNTNFNVNIQGRGNPVFLLHGLGGDISHFKELEHKLSKDFTTISYDLRGHGKSHKPNVISLQDHIDDLFALIAYFGLEKAHVLGNSMGSYIAQYAAISKPTLIDKLVLTVPKANGASSSVQRLFAEHANELSGKNMRERVKLMLKYFTYNPEYMKDYLYLFETTLPLSQFAIANKALANFDFRPFLPQISNPTLVISGKYDGLNPSTEGREVAKLIPNSIFVEMQYSGHAPCHEEPELYYELVKEFLED